MADIGRAPTGQALAVPATPANAVGGPSGFDPSRSEQSLRDKFNFLIGERGKPTAFARQHGLCDETVLAFLSGRRPPADKLLEAMGYRREYRYSPCPCFACSSRRTDIDPGPMMFGASVEMQRMFLCETCGNKRCPHAANHKHKCSGSNEWGQKGSLYEFPTCAAQGIEAQRAETTEIGSVADESPVPQGCAQTQPPSTPDNKDKPNA